jgi:hypothetical protein
MRSGLLAEFEHPEPMLAALHHLRKQGYRRLDAFTPWPVQGTDEALDLPRSPVAMTVLIAGLVGAAFAYLIQWYVNAEVYPLIVGARPAHAAPAFVPITFETTVLFAGIAALVAVFVCSGLPRLWDPVFEVPGFERASIDRFWVGIDAADPAYDADLLGKALLKSGALQVVAFDGGRKR